VSLSDDENAILGRLHIKVGRTYQRNKILDAYYNGCQRVEQLGLAIPPELRRFLTIVAWPGTYVDAIEERNTLEGFVLPDKTEADKDLWRVWQENDLDRESKLAHLDALVLGRSFVVVGAGDGETPDAPSAEDGNDDRQPDPATPLITVESANEMAAELSPRTREVVAAAKFYKDDLVVKATLYLTDQTIWLERINARWAEVDRDKHDLGVVPVVPLVNRMRLSDREGRSSMERVIGLTDAAARALTNAQIATEVMAIPQRYVLGASKGDFVDKDGTVLTTWEAYFGSIWALKNGDAKVGQFTAADLTNFKTIVDHYATLVSGVTGLPMRYLGQATTNPPSAEGILADESRLIKGCEEFQTTMEAGWERAMRIASRIRDGKWDPRLKQLETQWRNPATPTKAQAADSTVKLVQAGILPVEAGWEELGYSPAKRAKLQAMRDADMARDPIREIAAGLTPPAATDPAVTAPAADVVPA
jgi:hypothetical protein